MKPTEVYSGPERRKTPRDRMTVAEQAVAILVGRYKNERPSEAEFEDAKFTSGDEVKAAVSKLFDRLEGKLDAEKVAALKEKFERGVEIWERAGLFTEGSEKAGYLRPNFARDYEPLLTQEILAMTEAGAEFNRGYGTPVFSPIDIPLHHENVEKLSYFSLLKAALLKAYRSTAGGKEPNTLLTGPQKRVLRADEINLNEILWNWEKYLESANVVHNVQKLDTENHGGVSEARLLEGLAGNEKRTGGVMRFERDQLIMPRDVGQKTMSSLDWEIKLPEILPTAASAQDLKQAIAHVVYCLETRGWMPDFYDWQNVQASRVNLALNSFVPDEGSKGVVPALGWDVYDRRFDVDGRDADRLSSYGGVRPGVRMGI